MADDFRRQILMLAEHFFATGDEVAGDLMMLMNRNAPSNGGGPDDDIPTGSANLNDANVRISLDPDNPFPTSDQVDKTQAYIIPYNGNIIYLWTADELWKARQLTGTIIVEVPPVSTGKIVDIFLYWTGTEIAYDTQLWSSDSARFTDLDLQDGVYVKGGDPTRRWIGSLRVDSADKFQDTQELRWVFSHFNRREIGFYKRSSGTWSGVGGSFRPLNNDSTIRVQVLSGIADRSVKLQSFLQGLANGGAYSVEAGIGVNSTSANSAPLATRTKGEADVTTDSQGYSTAVLNDVAFGNTIYYPLELASATTTVRGDASGIIGTCWG